MNIKSYSVDKSYKSISSLISLEFDQHNRWENQKFVVHMQFFLASPPHNYHSYKCYVFFNTSIFIKTFQVQKLQCEIEDENETQAEISAGLKRISDPEKKSKLQISLVSLEPHDALSFTYQSYCLVEFFSCFQSLRTDGNQ